MFAKAGTCQIRSGNCPPPTRQKRANNRGKAPCQLDRLATHPQDQSFPIKRGIAINHGIVHGDCSSRQALQAFQLLGNSQDLYPERRQLLSPT